MPTVRRVPEYKSEVRDSTIMALAEKVADEKYGSYLKSLTLKRVRGFVDRVVTFDFPVTAVVGPNGGGKSTILGAAGLMYQDVRPRDFFAKSGKYDASMKDWKIEASLIDKEVNPRLVLQRTASFPEQKWNRHALDRQVLVFGVSRTVPATERPQLAKAIGNAFTAEREIALSEQVADAVNGILGKDISGFNSLYVDAEGRVTLFAGQTNGQAYSEFHFGAGEASVIRMVSEVEAASDNCLILIEEIENGLHPVATRRMVDYLIDVARRKSAQVIFTTHSNDALEALPPRAIWAAYGGEVMQGKLDINSLRTITGQVDAKLAVFVEDDFSVELTWTALRYYGGLMLDAINIHGMGGHGPAMKVNEQHNLDPTSSFPSVCLVDGDKQEFVDEAKSIYALPGDCAPEAYIFDQVMAKIETAVAKLTVAMLLPIEQQEKVKAVLKEKALTNQDRHVIYAQIGEALDFTSGSVVAGAFRTIWAQEYPEEVRSFVGAFANSVPTTASGRLPLPGEFGPSEAATGSGS